MQTKKNTRSSGHTCMIQSCMIITVHKNLLGHSGAIIALAFFPADSLSGCLKHYGVQFYFEDFFSRKQKQRESKFFPIRARFDFSISILSF